MKQILAIVALLSLGGCVGEYHATSAYPPTPDRRQAFAYCVNEAMNETPAIPGLAAALLEGPDRTQIQDACMLAHGWSRN